MEASRTRAAKCQDGPPYEIRTSLIEAHLRIRSLDVQDDSTIRRWRAFAERTLRMAQSEAEREKLKRRIAEIEGLLGADNGERKGSADGRGSSRV